jgi:hypothetical protein
LIPPCWESRFRPRRRSPHQIRTAGTISTIGILFIAGQGNDGNYQRSSYGDPRSSCANRSANHNLDFVRAGSHTSHLTGCGQRLQPGYRR